MNDSWTKWIIASIHKHLSLLEESDFKYQLDGKDSVNENDKTFEVRVDGPVFTQISHSDFKVDIRVNVLIQIPVTTNVYTINVLTGKIAEGFTAITVNKYGLNAEDDDSYLACLRPVGEIKIRDFGQIEPTIPLRQATVDGSFSCVLSS